jgi:hypothetical protein
MAAPGLTGKSRGNADAGEHALLAAAAEGVYLETKMQRNGTLRVKHTGHSQLART